MKKIVFLLIIGLSLIVSANAQKPLLSQYAKLTDTVTNTGTKSIVAPATNLYSRVQTVTLTATKVSGTVAGTASLQGSLDGVNWFTASATTPTLTDVASQTFVWTLSEPGAVYYRASVTGSGTMSAIISGKTLTRKQ